MLKFGLVWAGLKTSILLGKFSQWSECDIVIRLVSVYIYVCTKKIVV